MSVSREFCPVKQPSVYRGTYCTNNTFIYIKNMTIYSITNTGVQFYEIQHKNANSIIHFACHPQWDTRQICALLFDNGTVAEYNLATNHLVEKHHGHKCKEAIQTGRIHLTEQGVIVGAVNNVITTFCTQSNQLRVFQDLLPKKFKTTEMSASTIAKENLLALGSYDGLIVIIHLTDMSIKYTFRGHNYQITSFVWLTQIESPTVPVDLADECFDIYADTQIENEFGTLCTKKDVNSSYTDSDNDEDAVYQEPVTTNTNFDFVEACRSLKEDIMNAKEMSRKQRENVQPALNECPGRFDTSQGDGSAVASGGSNDTQASSTSSNIENLFERLDMEDVDEMHLISMDQHMTIWVWDLRANCAKGSFKLSEKVGKVKKNVIYPAQMYFLAKSKQFVVNTFTGNLFDLQLHWNQHDNTLAHDFNRLEGNAIILASANDDNFFAYHPYHVLKQMEHCGPGKVAVLKEYSVFNGSGRSIAISVTNQLRVAVGTNEICLFDLASLNDDNCKFTTYYKNIKSFVVALAWHPENEILAFGTLEGRVGIYNTNNQTVEALKPFSGSEIYDLAFARMGDEYALLATSNGVCVRYTKKYSEMNYILRNVKDVSSLYVDNNAKKVLVGTKFGYVFAFNLDDDLQQEMKLQPLKVSKNYIRMFRLNSDHSLIAVASKIPEILILTYANFNGNTEYGELIKLKGHSGPITWIDFSPTKANLLLSASYDCSLRLWELNGNAGGTVIAQFEFNRIFRYAIFSPLNEDCLIVGTHSTAFYAFNMAEKRSNYPPIIANVEQQQQHGVKNVKGAVKVGNNCGSAGNNSIPSQEAAKKEETTILYLTKKELNKRALECLINAFLIEREAGGGALSNEGSEYLSQKLFSNDLNDIHELLSAELANYRSSNVKTCGHEIIPMMNNSMREVIVAHLQGKTLTAEHVALAPMISFAFWQRCTEAFACQLVDAGQPLKAVLYMLAIHQVDAAINLLCDRHYYRESWILAKLRKSPDDNVFLGIAQKWIQDMSQCGDYEAAAVIASGVGNYAEALDQLERRHEDQFTADHRTAIKLLKERLQK